MNKPIPEVLICRNGHEHRGMYRIEDYTKCQCDHKIPESVCLIDGDDWPDVVMCMECGQTWAPDDPDAPEVGG